MISPCYVANNFINRALKENISITPLKLQKLVYFLYRSYLICTGEQLFSERFETWKLGPVIPSLYAEFQSYGDKSIKTFAKDSKDNVFMVTEKGKYKECLDDVWENYKDYSGIELSNFTHRENTAWSKAKKSQSRYLNDEDIKNEITV